MGDADKISLGDNADLQIYHEPTYNNSVIVESGSGNLLLGGTQINFRDSTLATTMANFNPTGSADLHHAGTKKFETTATGVTVTGTLVSDGVGIGTGTPASRLHIKANTNGYDGAVQIEDNSSSTKSAITHVGGVLYISSNATNDHMAILADGKVGIGTTSPTKLLHLYGDENLGGLGLVIQDDGWGAPNGMFMTTVRNSDGAYTIRKNTSNAMDFATYTDMLSVKGDGNVGIGTTGPDTRLHVAGTQNTPSSTSKGMLLVRADGSSHGLQMGVMGTSPWGSWIQAQDNDIATAYPLTLQPGGGIVHVPDTSRLIVGDTLSDATSLSSVFKNSLQQYTIIGSTKTSVTHPGSASSTKYYVYDRATVSDKINLPIEVYFPNGVSNLAIRLYYNDYGLWVSGEAITGSTYSNAQATGFRRYSFSHNYNGATNYENILNNTENVGLNSSHMEFNHHGWDANESGGAHYFEFRHIASSGNTLYLQFQLHGSGKAYKTGTWYFKCTTY